MMSSNFPVVYIVALSVVIQFAAAWMAIRLIGITGRRGAWGLIAAALALMTLRRLMALYHLMAADTPFPPDPVNEIIGLVLSIAMAVGISRIAPLFYERKHTEQLLRRLNRELRAISSCHQLLMRAKDEQALLNGICQIICAEAGYRMAWVGFVESDAAKSVHPVAWGGVEDGYLNNINVTCAAIERSPTGIAAHTGKTTCVQDFITDPSAAPWRENALSRGYRSSISLSLKDEDGNIFGVLTIYSSFANAFTSSEIRLLEELADDLALGITVLRTRGERKQAEAMRTQLAAIVEFSNDAIVGKTPSGIITHWNKGAERIYGYSADEMIGKHISVLAPASRQAEIQDLLEKIRNGETVINQECDRICKDGSLLQVALTLSPIKDAAGNITGISTIARDISERKKAERQLAELSLRNELILDSAGEGIYGLDIDGRCTFVNPAALKLLGLSADELIGRSSHQVFHHTKADGSPYPVSDCPVQAAYKHAEVYRGASLYWRKDGSSFPVEFVSTPILTAGKSTGAVVMFSDITERKRAEEELRRYKDHLEEEVQQRTVELVLARNAAEAANQAKSVFLANMSHELRTPLNAILGFSNMMRKAPNLADQQRQNLDIINRSGEHLLNLINDVLEMSKIESGRVQLENIPFDLGSVIRDIGDMMLIRAKEKGLRLLIDQDSRFPRYILGDEARLRQILINLVGNAVKFTQQGGVTLRLGTKKNKISHLLIEVEDSGPGIAPEDQQLVFEPFVQLGEQSANRGTGLGLSITRQFVQLMGGNISLISTLGKGSLFRVDLPLNEVTQADITATKSANYGDVTGLAPGQPAYRILIVEDQRDNQLLLAKLMESAGFQVKLAENGEQGVELFQSWHPHLIWMDHRMPVMDGLEATRRIRELPGGKAVKIVAVTASAFTEQRTEMFNAGMDDFIRKPYRSNEIYECLAKQLDVKYIYADLPEQEQAITLLTPAMLSVLPVDLRNNLISALESLETQNIALVIQQVASYDQSLQKTLAGLTENFDYRTILKALRELAVSQ